MPVNIGVSAGMALASLVPGNLPSLMRSRPRETVLAVAAAAILLFLTLFSFWLTERLFRDAETADELANYNAKLMEFVQTLRTVESSQRGYLITGAPEFLDAYKQKSSELLPLAQQLVAEAPKGLVPDVPVAALLEPLKAKLEEMAETVALVDGGQRQLAIARLKDGTGRMLTGDIETTAGKIQAAGGALIHRNAEKEQSLQRFKLLADGIGAALIFTFTLLSIWLLLRSTAVIQAAQDALAKSNLELEDIVAERTAALTRANAEIQRFAFIVSHDLRAPLVNIMGFTSELEILRQELFERPGAACGEAVPENLKKDFDEALSFIKSSIARMERLIAAILRISREGSRPLAPESIDTDALVESLFAAVAHQIRGKGATLRAGPLPAVVTDRLALEQIFANLIENAIKFLDPDKAGEIEVEGTIQGGDAVFMVRDNGRGIDPKDHQRIFELFRRAGPQDIPGEGIGLAYVSALLRRLGGTVEVKSEPGRGSLFTVKIPKQIAPYGRKEK